MTDLEARFFETAAYIEPGGRYGGRRRWVVVEVVVVPVHARRHVRLDLGAFDTEAEARHAANAQLEKEVGR